MLVWKKYQHLLYFALIALFITIPLSTDKYILTLDTIISPYSIHGAKSMSDFIYGFWQNYPNQDELGLSATRIPLLIVSSILQSIIPTFILQKIEIFLIFFLAMWSMYSLVQTNSIWPRYFAAFFYAINPFVYLRFMAGHWLILLAYALLPFFVKELLQEKKRIVPIVLWLSGLLVLSLHVFVIAFALLFFFFRKDEFRKYGIILLCFLVLNLYWIIPLALASSTTLSGISIEDAIAYETNQTFSSLLISVAMLYGFWREQAYLLPNLLFALALFAILLWIIIHGSVHSNNPFKKRFIIIGIGAYILALGSSFPLVKDLFIGFFSNVPFMEGFRESHKFTMLLALSYSYLGALGLDELKSKKIKAALIALPFIFTPFIFFGFFGQLDPIDYPADYYEMNDILNADQGEFNTLFMPWHLYMDFSWVENDDRRIANPSTMFFEKPIIRGDNAEVGGIYSSSANPISNYIVSHLNGTAKDLQILNVKYILVAKEFNQNIGDATLVKETKNLKLFRSNAQSSLFMQTDDFNEFLPLGYKKINPIKYEIEEPQKKFIVFARSRNEAWQLDGQKPMRNQPVNVYQKTDARTITFVKAKYFFAGYVISVFAVVSLIHFRKNEFLN